MDGSEKRRFQRVPQNLTSVLAGDMAGLTPRTIKITDLSSGGLGFESAEPLLLGEVVEFELPLAVPVQAKAQVVWAATSTEPKKYGAEFRGMELEDRIVLRSYLHMQMNALGLAHLEGDEAA